MSVLEPLCDYCEKVELDPQALSYLSELEIFPTWSLGHGARIKNSRCPICRLVKRVYYEYHRRSPDAGTARLSEITDVELRWLRSLGPGHRGVFSVRNTHDEHYICFARRHDTDDQVITDCYYLQPKLHSVLEVDRISRWLSMCTSSHSVDCNAKGPTMFEHAFPGLKVLRLIDVEKNCLVENQSLCQYVALSYVWGAVPNFRLTKANKHKLLASGGIEAVWTKLPRTIRDAIDLVGRLGLRYLWVDALCLLQNDREDLDLGTAVMDQVYEQSWLTIIAACGHDADAGLPGIHEGSRMESNIAVEVKRGISLGVYTAFDLLLKNSIYNSRAWTFQEHLLPRRAVYFVDNQVFFRCRQAEYAESCFDHHKRGAIVPSLTSLLPVTVYMETPLDDFCTMLLYYTRRSLTNEDDVLRAMAGIIRRFSERLKYKFLEGLPIGALDAFITFRPHGTLLHRRNGFPSYSWVGWKGHIDTKYTENDWLRMHTWIIWYKRSPSGITNLIWDPSANESFPIHDPEYIGYRERQPFQYVLPLPTIRTSCTTPTETLPFDLPRLSYPLLQFWTLAVFYKIGNVDVFRAYADVLATNGTTCGRISLDGFEETTFFESEGLFEFILLSCAWDDIYNVMLLEFNGGIAERRGIGTIKQSAVVKSYLPGPIWKEIVLA